jgi:hypothetical protein
MEGREIFLLVLVLITSGVGAYLGTYLREKGRNVATKEDIAEITEKVEQVRVQLTGGLWVDQERWKFKRDLYRELLEALYAMNSAMFRLVAVGSGEAAHLTHPLWGELKSASDQFTRAFSVAKVFLSEAAAADLDRLNLDMQEITGSSQVAGLARMAKMREPLTQATLRLASTAKADLRFRDR